MENIICNKLNKDIYCNSQEWLAMHLITFNKAMPNGKHENFYKRAINWAVYETQLATEIRLPYSEERLALVVYLYLNQGQFPLALLHALRVQNRPRIWIALLTAEALFVTQKQCAHLAEIFGLLPANITTYAPKNNIENSSGNVEETQKRYCLY